MSDTAISLDGIGKQYRLGVKDAGGMYQYKALRDSLVGFARRPWGVITDRQELTEANSFWALKDVSFEVKCGEVVGIIGRNGAGKSTLLKILSQITKPTTGEIAIRGRVGSLLEVGTGFHPELSGRANIYLNGAILGMTRGEVKSKFDEIVAFSEVERFLDTPVKQYSSGMYTRLAFAVAAHLEPEILVVDEVLAVGDAAFQKKCLGKMQDVAGEGRTVLFVSHQMNAVELLCDRAVLLDRGKMTSAGAVAPVIADYLHRSASEARWTAEKSGPLHPSFTPLNVGALPSSRPIRVDESWAVRIEFEVASPDDGLCVGIAVYTGDGHLLFSTYHTDTAQRDWPDVRRGQNTLDVQIPAGLLNEGDFRVEFVAHLFHRQWLLQPGVNAPAIHVQIDGGLGVSPHWTQRRPGPFAPTLKFSSPVADPHDGASPVCLAR